MSRFSAFSSRFIRIVPAALVAALALGWAGESRAVSVAATWNAANTGNWATGSNWLGNTAPSSNAAQDLVFGGTSSVAARNSVNATNNIQANFALNNLIFSGTTQYILSGSSLTLSGNIDSLTSTRSNVVNNAITVTASSTLSSAVPLSLSGPITLSGSNSSLINLSGTTTFGNSVTGGGTLANAAGAVMVYNGTTLGADLQNGGQFTPSTSSNITIAGIQTMTLQGTSDVTMSVGATSGAIVDPGTGGQQSYDQLTGTTANFGGLLNLNFAGLFDGTTTLDPNGVQNYTSNWDLFSFGSYNGNFTGINGIGAPAGWTALNASWTVNPEGGFRSADFNAAGQYLAFEPSTGVLMVVPEPSAVMIAGLGVALAGWKLSRKRKAAKAAAKQA